MVLKTFSRSSKQNFVAVDFVYPIFCALRNCRFCNSAWPFVYNSKMIRMQHFIFPAKCHHSFWKIFSNTLSIELTKVRGIIFSFIHWLKKSVLQNGSFVATRKYSGYVRFSIHFLEVFRLYHLVLGRQNFRISYSKPSWPPLIKFFISRIIFVSSGTSVWLETTDVEMRSLSTDSEVARNLKKSSDPIDTKYLFKHSSASKEKFDCCCLFKILNEIWMPLGVGFLTDFR